MKKLLLTFYVCSIISFCSLKAGRVLLANVSKKNNFKVLHMATRPEERLLERRDMLYAGCCDCLKNVQTEKGEDIWVAEAEWKRFIAGKMHYVALLLSQVSDYVVFLTDAKPGMIYGGDLRSEIIQVDKKNLGFIERIKYIHEVMMPAVKKLQDQEIKRYVFIKQSFEKMKRFKKRLEDFKDMPDHYKDFSVCVDVLYKKFATVVGEKNGGISPDELYSRKNIRRME